MGFDVNGEINLTNKFQDMLDAASTGVDAQPKFDLNANIDNILLDQSLNLQKLELKRQKANYLPTLSTFYTWKESRITNEGDQLFDPLFRVPGGTILGVNLSVPIFKGLSQRARVQTAKLNISKIEVSAKQASQGLALQSAQSLTSYTAALSNIQNARESVQLAERIRDRTLIKFQEGVGSSVELLQAENELLNAQANYVSAAQQLIDSRVTLDKNLNKF
jgi:outer membrane protein TolC